MKRTATALVVSAILAGGAAAPATAANLGEQGCTPGYWKNHTSSWLESPTVRIPTTKTLASAGFVTTRALTGDTLLEALGYQGGSGAAGAERILLRAAAAAWLNAAHEGIGYPYRRDTDPLSIVKSVNRAIASGDRAKMLALAATLDAANNLGCPL